MASGKEPMETKANHVLIGAFVLALLVAVFGFVYWIQHAAISAASKSYGIRLRGPVIGLTGSATVFFNGLNVGKVQELRIYRADTRFVEVIVRLNKDTPIRSNSYARIAQQGLTGLPAILITPGTPDAPLLQSSNKGELAYIKADRAISRPLLEAAPELLGNANAAINRISDLIANNEDRVTNTITNMEAFSQVLSANRDAVAALLGRAGSLGPTFERVGAVLANAEQLIGRLDGMVASNEGAVERTMQNVEAFTSELEQNKGKVGAIIDEAHEVASELKGAGEVLREVGVVVGRVNDLVGENADSVQRSLANVVDFTNMLNENRSNVQTIIKDVKGATSGIRDAGMVLSEVGNAANKVNKLIADNEEAIQQSLENVKSFTTVLQRNQGDVDDIVADIKAVSSQLRRVAVKMEVSLDRITTFVDDGDGGSLVEDLRQAVASFRGLAAKLDVALGDNAEGLARTAKRSLQEFEMFMQDGRRAAGNLDRVLDKIERNPQSLIFGGSSVPEYNPTQ